MINNSDGTLYILLGMFLENISVIIYYKHSYFKNLSLGNSTMYSIMEKRNLCNVKPWWCIIIYMMTITECVTYVMKYIHYNVIMCNIVLNNKTSGLEFNAISDWKSLDNRQADLTSARTAKKNLLSLQKCCKNVILPIFLYDFSSFLKLRKRCKTRKIIYKVISNVKSCF